MVGWGDNSTTGRSQAFLESLLSRDAVNVKGKGAVGDARQVADAAISNGSQTLTSATAAFSAADVGKTVALNATSGAATLVTTITAYTNPTTVTLAAPAPAAITSGSLVIGTNNVAAFGNAMTQAGPNGTVTVPPGTYMFPTPLLFAVANQTIHLARGVTLLSASGGNSPRPFQINADGITFTGEGAFDGNFSATPTLVNHTIIIVNGGHVGLRFFDVTVKNSGFYGIQANNSSNLVFRDCNFSNTAGASITSAAFSGGTADNIRIDGCYFDNATVGIPPGYANVYGGAITVGNLKPSSGGLPTTNVRIVNNHIKCPPAGTPGMIDTASAIYGYLVDSVISNNTVEGSFLAISHGFLNRVAINNNVVSGAQGYAIEIASCTNVTCCGNVVDGRGVTGCGIMMDGVGSQNVTITGNAVSNMATVTGTGSPIGIALSGGAGPNLVVSANFVEMSCGTGIYNSGGSGVSITGNRCHNTSTGAVGIFSSSAGDVIISNNGLTGSWTLPIQLYEATAQTRNRLTVIGNNADSAPVVTKVVTLTLGTGCRIHSNGADVALTGV